MSNDDSFSEVMTRLRAGDEGAAAQVFRRFTHRLIGLARVHLDGRMRQKVDPEDVLQSVYKSFFLRHAQGQFDFRGWEGLWSLLTVITVRKCGRWRRLFHAARRDVRDEATLGGGADESNVIEVFSEGPSPTEAVVLSELVEEMARELGQRDGDILMLALQGHTPAEISEQLGRPSRTVYRVLERIKRRLQTADDEAAPATE